MRFLRHEQIYQFRCGSGCLNGTKLIAASPRAHVLMNLRPGIPRRVALQHCSLPLRRSTAMVNRVTGCRQPPLSRGWGIFDWRNGEFSAGVDTNVRCCEVALAPSWAGRRGNGRYEKRTSGSCARRTKNPRLSRARPRSPAHRPGISRWSSDTAPQNRRKRSAHSVTGKFFTADQFR
jgi:hypothetical protein